MGESGEKWGKVGSDWRSDMRGTHGTSRGSGGSSAGFSDEMASNNAQGTAGKGLSQSDLMADSLRPP